MYLFANIRLPQKDAVKTSIWLSERMHYTTMFIRHDKRRRRSLDKRGHYVAHLTDLCKAFDCLSHDCKIACIWFWYSSFKVAPQLPYKQKTACQDTSYICFLGRYIISCTTRFNFMVAINIL